MVHRATCTSAMILRCSMLMSSCQILSGEPGTDLEPRTGRQYRLAVDTGETHHGHMVSDEELIVLVGGSALWVNLPPTMLTASNNICDVAGSTANSFDNESNWKQFPTGRRFSATTPSAIGRIRLHSSGRSTPSVLLYPQAKLRCKRQQV